MNVNRPMKMIGCSVTSSSASGLRTTPIRLRLASTRLWRISRSAELARLTATVFVASAAMAVISRLLQDGGLAAGEREEDLVEARQVQRELADGDARGVDARDRVGEHLVARDGRADGAVVDLRPRAGDLADDGEHLVEARAVDRPDRQRLAADDLLEA